jgi:hypothetical protein
MDYSCFRKLISAGEGFFLQFPLYAQGSLSKFVTPTSSGIFWMRFVDCFKIEGKYEDSTLYVNSCQLSVTARKNTWYTYVYVHVLLPAIPWQQGGYIGHMLYIYSFQMSVTAKRSI